MAEFQLPNSFEPYYTYKDAATLFQGPIFPSYNLLLEDILFPGSLICKSR